MVETKKTAQEAFSEYTVIYIENLAHENITYKAIGTYKDQEEAYAAAIVNQLQVIEHASKSWPKTILTDKQDHIIELYQKLKHDFTTYQDRFTFLTAQCNQLFEGLLNNQHQVLAVNNTIKPKVTSESIFKTKLRNFLDVLQTRTDIEEDLDNSDEDDDDEEDEDEEEEDNYGEEDIGEEESELEGGEESEEDMQEEDDDEDCNQDNVEDDLIEEEEEEGRSNINIVPETTEDELEEEEEGGSGLKRDVSALDDDDEEDEIEEDVDEDNDEDELEEDDSSSKRRRIVS